MPILYPLLAAAVILQVIQVILQNNSGCESIHTLPPAFLAVTLTTTPATPVTFPPFILIALSKQACRFNSRITLIPQSERDANMFFQEVYKCLYTLSLCMNLPIEADRQTNHKPLGLRFADQPLNIGP